MENLSGIRNIIFDLGGVLLDLDFESPVREFSAIGKDGENFEYRQAIKDPVFLQFETGEISPDKFRERIRKMLGNPLVTDEVIDAAWCSMLLRVPVQKVRLLQQLSHSFRLFLFSNTNEIHISHFKKSFEECHGLPVDSLFEKTFYSHEIKDRKPRASSFRKVTELAGIDPDETLFVDDFEQNIAAAREFGLRVLHYIPGEDLSAPFRLNSER